MSARMFEVAANLWALCSLAPKESFDWSGQARGGQEGAKSAAGYVVRHGCWGVVNAYIISFALHFA